MGTAGQDARPRRRADRAGGIKAIKPKAVGGHVIEVRRLEDRMLVVAGLAPSLVISHYEDDVGSRPYAFGRTRRLSVLPGLIPGLLLGGYGQGCGQDKYTSEQVRFVHGWSPFSGSWGESDFVNSCTHYFSLFFSKNNGLYTESI